MQNSDLFGQKNTQESIFFYFTPYCQLSAKSALQYVKPRQKTDLGLGHQRKLNSWRKSIPNKKLQKHQDATYIHITHYNMYKLHIHVYTEKSTAVSALLPDPKTILQFIGEETAVNWGFYFYNILDNKHISIVDFVYINLLYLWYWVTGKCYCTVHVCMIIQHCPNRHILYWRTTV